MISMTTGGAGPRPASLRTWRLAAGLTGAAAGATIVTGAFLPWVAMFAGLIQVPGVRGGNGRILAAAGILIAAAAVYHLIRGGTRSRWLVGIGGFAAAGFSGYLLIQLAATTRALGDSMVLARGGPGLWVTAAGSLLALATLFLPAPSSTRQARRPGRLPAQGTWAGRVRAGVLTRAADLESGGIRRGLQIALGLVWLLDAALQLQPYMFGHAFVGQMLAPTAMGNPAPLAGPALWAYRLIGHDVPAWNSAFAVIQLAIALGMLWRPTVKAALAGSVVWALSVWWLGEGLGGVLTGSATPVTGAPGAAILYALIAVLVWPRHPGTPGGSACGGVAATGPLGGRWSRVPWLVLWGSLAYLVLQPAVRAPRALSGVLAANAAGEPGWLATLDRGAAAAAGPHGTVVSAAAAAAFVLIAAGVLFPATARPAVILAAVAGLAIWVAGENFGALLTGTATDPNSGPLLILLAVAYWPLRPKRCPRPARLAGWPGYPARPDRAAT